MTPRSLTWRVFTVFQVSVFHLTTKARRGDDFVRVFGGTLFDTVYNVLSSDGWNLHGCRGALVHARNGRDQLLLA